MKKIMLLLMLLISLNVISQDCVPPTMLTEIVSEGCPTGPTLFFGAIDFGGATSVELYVKNLTQDTTPEIFTIYNPNEFFPFGPYAAGDLIEVIGNGRDALNNPCGPAQRDEVTMLACSEIDNDQDGYFADEDCDDTRSAVNPGATEICNFRDDNCDGNIDEGVGYIFYSDRDGDTFGDPNSPVRSCNSTPTGNLVDNNTDCDDSDISINPGATEVCGDGVDNNCDGNIDEGCDCPDADSDTVCDADDICPGFDDLADADADGTPDGCDACPNDVNKTELGACGCGVADIDTDSDGVLDCNDNEINSPCPNNVDVNGVSIDSDSDGTPDCLDNCPNDANKTDPGACGCGVADTDSDGDGTPDCNDACPNDANKTEPGACGCGTPDTDTDADGIPDCNDTCPNDPTNTCNNCPDADNDTVCDANDICPGSDDLLDSDNDGTPDCLDNCPNDADKTELGVCGCDVADTDSDSDGTPDCNDACPNDANKTEAGDCGCGVADTDTDNDGTPDCIDACPNDPNKIAPGDCGCDALETDSDRDGTPDCIDNCPDDRNKTEPGLCGCGTTDADKDLDGVPDCEDVCPRGPDTDSDGDGVPDCIDICPNGPDTDSDGDGIPNCVDTCPDDDTNTCTANTCRPGYFEICHVKKNGDATTLCVTPAQWERHKSHSGDALGACSIPPAATKVASENRVVLSKQPIIYPNPIKSNGLWIKFSSKENTAKFTASIYDLNGRKLAEKVFDSSDEKDSYFWEFNHGAWDKGMFMLKIEDGNSTYYTRILKLNN